MEAEYGRFVYSNYQYQPWRREPAARRRQVQLQLPAAHQGSEPAPLEAPSLAPAALPQPMPPEPAVASGTTPSSSSRSVFRLAPPPPTAAICSVSSAPVAEDKVERGSLVIESLIEERAKVPQVGIDRDAPLAPQDDDEECLLGEDLAPPSGAVARRKQVSDGVDSDSEAEGTPPPGDLSPPPQPKPAQMAVPTLPMQQPGRGAEGGKSPADGLRGQALCEAPEPPCSPSEWLPSPDWGKRFGTMAEVDSQLNVNLDKFFSDERQWQRVAKEVSSTRAKFNATMDRHSAGRLFRVQVPKPYPGVQYRKSKSLDDRYPRYAKHGSTVTGEVEDDGEWLRISGNVFLPMKVGTISILEPLPREACREGTSEDDRSARWWACGPGPGGEPAQPAKEPCGLSQHCLSCPAYHVVVGQDGYLNIPEGLNQHLPWEEARSATQQATLDETAAALAAGLGAMGRGKVSAEDKSHKLLNSQEAKPHAAVVAVARSLLNEQLPGNQLSNLEAANRILADPINPFSDTPRGGSPSESPLRSRPVSLAA